ncbi:MAG: hypothetical protein HZA51_03520 [Planctomycetes bacterium]|nr:hypothetical protein [Planctomycetota bacterium]
MLATRRGARHASKQRGATAAIKAGHAGLIAAVLFSEIAFSWFEMNGMNEPACKHARLGKEDGTDARSVPF